MLCVGMKQRWLAMAVLAIALVAMETTSVECNTTDAVSSWSDSGSDDDSTDGVDESQDDSGDIDADDTDAAATSSPDGGEGPMFGTLDIGDGEPPATGGCFEDSRWCSPLNAVQVRDPNNNCDFPYCPSP
ncbi:hypothetical protein BBJ28_00003749 [Nothophytophthora sp. Chile5]|nr:hypothetical protein BBJ28_00003749 [Nothophytophthora sp. Chile5]